MIPSYTLSSYDVDKNMSSLEYSGWALINKIASNESVLDVGCGLNVFKGKIANLTGIDPVAKEADVRVSLEDYTTDQRFDVALCLGSFRYGTREHIQGMIEKLVSLLKPTSRIYWRTRPHGTGYGADGNTVPDTDIFFWCEQDHTEWARQFGFEVADLKRERTDDAVRVRIYAEWRRVTEVI
jgi:hypothetical protein